MQDFLDREHYREAAFLTMATADPDRAEELFKDYFGAGSSSWTGWDEQFVMLIEDHRRSTLLYGTAGDGWHFVFVPEAGKGFWVLAHGTTRGKGLLGEESIEELREIAKRKGLWNG